MRNPLAAPLTRSLSFPKPMQRNALTVAVANTLIAWRRIWARQDRAEADAILARLHATVQAHAAPEIVQLPEAPKIYMPGGHRG